MGNILNAQMAIEFAKETKKEMLMLQLVIGKAYDNVNWSFIYQLMHRMGFGCHGGGSYGDGIGTQEDKYALQLNGTLLFLFQKVWSWRHIQQS